MAWTSDVFYFFEVEASALGEGTLVLFGQCHHFLLIAFADELPDDFLCYIPADILIVVALVPYFLFFYLLEQSQPIYLRVHLGPFCFEGVGRATENDVMGE